jgi:transposase
MESWLMIHKVKALHDQGKGLSIRLIAEQLDLSKTTVQKYLTMTEDEIDQCVDNPHRIKLLDQHQGYIIHLLQKFPRLSAIKVQRKLAEKGIALEASDRSLRRYLNPLKKVYPIARERYYEPVLDMVPGVQCQVDLGEIREVPINHQPRTIYFGVFVLSFSRLLYVSLSEKPVDTRRFIQMHSEAWSYFEGVPEECVYDQTKLVVIREEFREVWFNEAFYRFATHVGFDCRICEGFDPESKGKVEAGVKYVKNNFFYSEEFSDWPDLQERSKAWLDTVANRRIHGTTKQLPIEKYLNEEKGYMRAWQVPPMPELANGRQTRQVDKVSLISHKAVKYSVPHAYQSSAVHIKEEDDALKIYDITTGEVIACHHLCDRKGEIVKNTNHYRDHHLLLSDLEKRVCHLLGDEVGEKISGLLRASAPKIYRDQLSGLLKVLEPYQSLPDLKTVMEQLAERPRVTVTFIRDFVAAWYAGKNTPPGSPEVLSEKPGKSVYTLDAYRQLQDRQVGR